MAPRYMSPMIRRRPAPESQKENIKAPAAEKSMAKELSTSNENEIADEGNIPEESVRIAFGSYRQIRDFSLVLLSQGIIHRLERSENGPFEIFVTCENAVRSEQQLKLYIKENPPREKNPPLPLSFSLQPLWILLVPTLCTVADFSNTDIRIFANKLSVLGISDAAKVLHGEWFRTITALTLHGDSHHLMGNLVSGYIVLNLMAYRIPLARMAPFLAIASAIANYLVAATVQTNYRALGFSTFVFASIGAVSVIEFRLMPKESHGLLRRFAPLCGAASLAVFLGLGEHADILGHVYGFLMGLLCGLIPQKKMLRWGAPNNLSDILWATLYFTIFFVGWKFALS